MHTMEMLSRIDLIFEARVARLDKALQDVQQRFTHLSLKQLCKVGDMDITRLPGYDRGGGSTVCYLSLLGLCNFDDSSCFNKLVDTQDLTESFVDEFAKMFIPALEKYMKDEG